MDEAQLLKGILEGCILALISRDETYGYDIIMRLEKYSFSNLQDGTLYPILTRLEKKGLIVCRVGKSPMGPKRKYYSITDQGNIYLLQFKDAYVNITNRAHRVLFEDMEGNKDE